MQIRKIETTNTTKKQQIFLVSWLSWIIKTIMTVYIKAVLLKFKRNQTSYDRLILQWCDVHLLVQSILAVHSGLANPAYLSSQLHPTAQCHLCRHSNQDFQYCRYLRLYRALLQTCIAAFASFSACKTGGLRKRSKPSHHAYDKA